MLALMPITCPWPNWRAHQRGRLPRDALVFFNHRNRNVRQWLSWSTQDWIAKYDLPRERDTGMRVGDLSVWQYDDCQQACRCWLTVINRQFKIPSEYQNISISEDSVGLILCLMHVQAGGVDDVVTGDVQGQRWWSKWETVDLAV